METVTAQARTRPAWLRPLCWESPSDTRWEVAIVVVLLMANVVVGIVGALPWEGRFDSPGPWVTLAAQCVVTPVFLWRRQYPLIVSSIVMITVLLAVLCAPRTASGQFPLMLSLDGWLPLAASITANTVIYFGQRSPRGWIVWGLLVLVTVIASRPWDPHLSVLYGGITFVAVPALIGAYVAARGRLLRELRDRAERAERDRELAAGQARRQERMRLASDLHDVVTHRISLMVLQAGAVRMSTVDPTVRTAAEDLRTVGCEALEELRDMIGVLRVDVREPK